jgi:hypothetical protein
MIQVDAMFRCVHKQSFDIADVWASRIVARGESDVKQPNGSLLSIPNRAILECVKSARCRKVVISPYIGYTSTKGPIVIGETEQPVWIEAWARRIDALGLSSMILLLLDIVHAFGFLGSQALLMIQPLAAGIVNDVTIERTVALLDNPELLEQFTACLKREEGVA